MTYHQNPIKITTYQGVRLKEVSELLTFPLMFGSFVGSILPTSQDISLETGSKEYFPCEGVNVTFNTDFGKGTSNTTFST